MKKVEIEIFLEIVGKIPTLEEALNYTQEAFGKRDYELALYYLKVYIDSLKEQAKELLEEIRNEKTSEM